MKEDIFLVKMNSPAPAPTFSSPLLARLLVSNLKAWEFMSGDEKNYPRANKGSFRWEGQEYSQRPVYRGPASSVLYFSEQPTYSCWMVGKRH